MKLRFHRKTKYDLDHYKCPGCKRLLDVAVVRANTRVCPECGYHFALPCRERTTSLLDDADFCPLAGNPIVVDPLEFEDRIPYTDRLAAERDATGLDDMAVAGTGRIQGAPVVLGVTDLGFLRGSMGVAGGELMASAAELALDRGWPLVIVANSVGGARIHEGAFALMQMAKTAAAIARLHEAGGLFISVIANPTMGGVMASFAALGDVTLAEPGAVAGFTGFHIIQETVKKDLPAGFQTAEYLVDRGFVDAVVPRPELPQVVARVIDFCCGGRVHEASPQRVTAKR